MTRSRARCSCSGRSAATPRHSAYRFRVVTVEYRWHPFHGRRFRVRRSGGPDKLLHLAEGDEHVSRELPEWMCDAATCRTMTSGPPLVRADALRELSEALAALLPNRADRSSADSPLKETAGEAEDGTTANPTFAEPGACGSGSAEIGSAGAGSLRSSAGSPRFEGRQGGRKGGGR